MSRSWERKVRRNTEQLNKSRKKQGLTAIKPNAEKVDRFRGRSFAMPILLLVIVSIYIGVTAASGQSSPLTWTTIGLYLFMALVLFLRKPYLSVGQDYVQTRRMFGDRRLKVAEIKSISVQSSSIIIQPVKGANWIFSRTLNRYPISEMKDRLQLLASQHQIMFQESK